MVLSRLFLVTEPRRSQLLRSADALSFSITEPRPQLLRSASACLSRSPDFGSLS